MKGITYAFTGCKRRVEDWMINKIVKLLVLYDLWFTIEWQLMSILRIYGLYLKECRTTKCRGIRPLIFHYSKWFQFFVGWLYNFVPSRNPRQMKSSVSYRKLVRFTLLPIGILSMLILMRGLILQIIFALSVASWFCFFEDCLDEVSFVRFVLKDRTGGQSTTRRIAAQHHITTLFSIWLSSSGEFICKFDISHAKQLQWSSILKEHTVALLESRCLINQEKQWENKSKGEPFR
jgi:hypothetical protein